MLKKVIFLLLALTLVLTLAACTKETPPITETPNNGQNSTGDQQGGAGNKDQQDIADNVYDWNFLSNEGYDKNNMTEAEINVQLERQTLRWEISNTGTLRLKGICNAATVPTFYDKMDQPWRDFTTLQSNDAGDGRPALKKLIVEPTVMALPAFAFDGCSELETVSLPVTLSELPPYCFRGCEALTSVTGSVGVQTVGEYALADCSKLFGIELSDALTAVQTGAFYGSCDKLGNDTATGEAKALLVYMGSIDELWLAAETVQQALDSGVAVTVSGAGNSPFKNARIVHTN